MTRTSKDPLVEVRLRIDELLTVDVPLMVSRGQLAEPQLFEVVGVLGLWMRATVGAVDDDIADAIAGFINAVRDTYANDPRSLGEKLHIHIGAAFADNPALAKFKQLIAAAMATDADDPASQASARFVENAMATTPTPEITAYFEVLAGG